MNLRDSVTESVEQANTNSGRQEKELEQIEVDFDEIPFVKFYPSTYITGTFPEDEGNPIIRFPDASNNDGRRDQGYLGIVLDDLSINTHEDETGFDMSEATFLKTADSDSTEYRAVNFNDPNTSEAFGGAGVDIDGDKYEIEDRVDSIDGRAILVVDRTASKNAARRLDVNGAPLAGMDRSTGDVNGGLIEYALRGDNGEPVDVDGDEVPVRSRYARNPVLREELYGTEVGFLVTWRSDVDDDYAERVADPDDPTRDMMYYSVFNQETEEMLEPVEGELPGGTYTFLEFRFDPSAGNIAEEDEDFVKHYIEAVKAGETTDDEETILQNIEDNLDDLSDDPNKDRIVAEIQEGVAAQ